MRTRRGQRASLAPILAQGALHDSTTQRRDHRPMPARSGGSGTASPKQGLSAKTWVGRYREIEEYLRIAECVRMLQGLTLARQRGCTLPPGGPIARMAWRSPPDGIYRGFRESYKTEIAAYELDKLLKMDMVPPTVERQLQGIKGAAPHWVDGAIGVQADESPDESHRAHWENQLAQMTMFDNLIGNRDRNRGNHAPRCRVEPDPDRSLTSVRGRQRASQQTDSRRRRPLGEDREPDAASSSPERSAPGSKRTRSRPSWTAASG